MVSEAYLDSLFISGARDKEDKMQGKNYQYRLYDDNFRIAKSGECSVCSIYYDKVLDCNVISVVDINTSEIISRDQFHLQLGDEI